jgi:fusion and transport protein UGO1
MWGIVYDEGVMPPAPETQAVEQILNFTPTSERTGGNRLARRPRKGQGVRGLYRTWRMEMWGIVGIWGSGILGALLGAGEEEMGSSAADRMGAGTGVRF